MPFEYDKLQRTLLIERATVAGKRVYQLHPFMRVTRDTGDVYLEPVPFENFVYGVRDLYLFDNIEFIDPPATRRDENAGMVNLTNVSGHFAVRRTA